MGKKMLMNTENSLIVVVSACVVWIYLDVPCEVKGSKKENHLQSLSGQELRALLPGFMLGFVKSI